LSLGYAQEGYAQEGGANRSAPDGKVPEKQTTTFLRRLDAVTWNPVRAELTWMVSVWDLRDGERTLVTKERYTMHPDVAVMESSGEYRRYDADEAKRLRTLMDMISTYAVNSTVWWDYGPDAKMDGQVVPLPDQDAGKDRGDGKTEKDAPQKDQPAPKAAPSRMLVGPRAEPGEPLADPPAPRG
jgi:hypothetical protein